MNFTDFRDSRSSMPESPDVKSSIAFTSPPNMTSGTVTVPPTRDLARPHSGSSSLSGMSPVLLYTCLISQVCHSNTCLISQGYHSNTPVFYPRYVTLMHLFNLSGISLKTPVLYLRYVTLMHLHILSGISL